MKAETCFHCGEPVPAGFDRTVTLDGIPRPVCCIGCEAVAGLIAGSGLTDFYRYRDGPAPTPAHEPADEWRAFDRDSVQAGFVTTRGDGTREAVLAVEGLYCAACAWLIEHVAGRLAGVTELQVNPATGRALLVWDPERTALSPILGAISRAGYRPYPVAAAEAVPVEARERRAALKRLGVAGLGMMQVMMYAVGLYAGAIHSGMDPDIERFLVLVSLFIATPVVLYSGVPFFRGAWRDLRARRPGMDVPVALAVGGAYAASVWNALIAGGEVYFDSVTMFVFFLTVARYLEMAARHRATRLTAGMARTLPATAVRIEGGTETRIGLAELVPGDTVRVRAGETVPADGEIVAGDSHLDESLLTGEFMPVQRTVGDTVRAGSVNTGDPFDMRVTRTGLDTLVSGIARLLDRAQAERPRLARAADSVARWFVAGVLVVAAGTAVYWTLHDPAEAFAVTLSVLVVTCPCALSLATPTALTAAAGRMARAGFPVIHTGALEVLARADIVLFDKTGTLTRGRLSLVDTAVTGIAEPVALARAAALEAHSEHPIARAFAVHADGRQASHVRIHRGLGVEGTVDGECLRLGRPDWAAGEAGDETTATVVVLGDGSRPLARFELADTPRPGAADAVRELREIGLDVEIVSGDAVGPVAALAGRLGIDTWHARLSPDDKLARIRALQAEGRRVVMVGDGINDAPVLAGADAAIAMGGGSALAQRGADLLLVGERLDGVADAVRLARRTLNGVRQNLAWALCYNAAALPLAVAGFVEPWMAALGMSASSVIVVANAMRLGRGSRARSTAAHEVPGAAQAGAA